MDYSLPFDLEIAAPPGDQATSVMGPVAGYAVLVESDGGTLLVSTQRRFRQPDGAGIANRTASATVPANNWPEFAPELLVAAAAEAEAGPAFPAAFALVLGRPDLVDWDDNLRATVFEWPDDRVRAAAVLHLRDMQ